MFPGVVCFQTGLEKEPNPEGIEFYHNVFDECKKYNIEPLITMIHYDTPMHFTETINGWESPEIVDFFVKYTKFLIDEYKNKVKYWITFNEINMVMNSSYLGGLCLLRNPNDQKKNASIKPCIINSSQYKNS